ncbi:uncharacterized protein GGS22DRAFT_190533 [Annulohypoxylon maeteangense]|uniref:uncharacterized protein n=1 Tax=Annulohypoxylon maeteangense TaxID=1927788 RepID=UPI002007C92C|nr:uncharacterized protein GGS22DRAFT_190533 [Annulohypoxylon maeteangense]KAI0883220.1 hypothetical protein GGS22DRAFT_190533 [Annulohypoxylon maeteangense]
MQFSNLSIAVLSALLSTAVALPATETSSVGAPSPTPKLPASGFEFKDVQVHCPDADHQKYYMQCYNDNAPKQCDPMKDEPSRHMCRQLWEIMCAQRNECPVSQN